MKAIRPFTQSFPSDPVPSAPTMNAAGGEDDVTSFPTLNFGPRRNHMKKLARAAALPVLAALLSACATPPGGGNLGASDSLTQGQKKEVGEMLEAWGARLPRTRSPKEVKEVVIQKKAREVLKELEVRPNDTLGRIDRIDGAAVKKGLDELVALKALDQDKVNKVLRELPDPGRWSPADATKVRKDLKLAEVAGLDDFKLMLGLSEDDSKFIRRETFRFDLELVSLRENTKKHLEDIFRPKKNGVVGGGVERKYGKGVSVTRKPDQVGEEVYFSYDVENPAGLEEAMLDGIKNEIRGIPARLDRKSASIRSDLARTTPEIPIHRTFEYIGIGDPIKSRAGCHPLIVVTLQVTEPSKKKYMVLEEDGTPVQNGGKPVEVIPDDKNQIAQYDFPVIGEIKGGKCSSTESLDGRYHYVMVTPDSLSEKKLVAQYSKVTLRDGRSDSVIDSRYSHERPACPPTGDWPRVVQKNMGTEIGLTCP